MRKLLLLLLLCVPLIGSAQSKFTGFFKPVPDNLFPQKYFISRGANIPGTWLFRPQLSLTAVQLNYDKQLQKITAKNFVNAWIGIGYSHFVNLDGEPFNNYGFNLLLLFGQEQPVTPARESSVSLAAVFNALGWVNVGPVFDLGSNKLGLLTGVSIKF